MYRFALILAGACLASATPSLAGPAFEFVTPANSFNNNNWNFANSFTVLSTVTVSGLGYYADPANGQVNNNSVALFRCDTAGCLTTGTKLASATVTNTYAIFGHFRYVTVANVTLTPGDYEVAGVSVGDNYTWNNPGFHTDASIVYNDNRWQLTGGATNAFFVNSTRNDVTDGYWGPNVFFGASGGGGGFAGTPEPASWVMLITGFGLVGGALRNMRRRPVAVVV